MTLKAFTRSLMESFEDLAERFNNLCVTDHGTALAYDEATAVIAVMTAVVASLLNRDNSPGVLQKIVIQLTPFIHRRVLGADIYNTNGIVIRDSSVRIDEAERDVRNQMSEQVNRYGWYIHLLDRALEEVGKHPVADHTTANLRAAFLRKVDFHNTVSDEPLDLAADFGLEPGVG